MQPNDDRHVSIPARDTAGQPTQKPDRDLAVALMREQINRLYGANSHEEKAREELTAAIPPATTPASVSTASSQQDPGSDQMAADPYHQIHDIESEHEATGREWQKYHSAWQQYYQQYYERYYLAKQYESAQKRQVSLSSSFPRSSHRYSSRPATEPSDPASLSKRQALGSIQNEIISKVTSSAKRARGSRHFVPIMSAICVMVVFLFLQYNRLMFAQVKAYVSPGSINPQNVILDTTTDVKVSPEPKVIIPKINVDAPVVYGLTTLDEGPVQSALKNGVIHYPIPGASANPGEKGNAVFLGHSSNDVFDDGGYKFVFVQLDALVAGDKFYLNYQGTRYTYRVTSKETILPNQVDKLIQTSDVPTATLVTCTPVGTAEKRLLIHAEQISPDPSGATSSSGANPMSDQPGAITGNSPTLFERLFGQ